VVALAATHEGCRRHCSVLLLLVCPPPPSTGLLKLTRNRGSLFAVEASDRQIMLGRRAEASTALTTSGRVEYLLAGS
jgi:hypothetical protein